MPSRLDRAAPVWRAPTLFLGAFALAACATTSETREPSELDTLTSELAARERLAAEAAPSSDPLDYWSGVLDATSPAIRTARRALEAAEADARAIGPGEAPMFEASHIQNDRSGSMRETELVLAFDVAGLVGRGRSGAARARALAAAEVARAELAVARNEARRELFEALALLAVARELSADLDRLHEEIAPSLARIDLLSSRGWLPPTEVESARAMVHHVIGRRAELDADLAKARVALVRATGLPPASRALDDDARTGVRAVESIAGRLPAERDARDARALLERHPDLQRARALLVEAEAEVRIASAEQWPALLLGPKARFTADDFLFGGLLRLELPWPSSAAAAVDSARVRRDEARAALADAFASAQARQESAALTLEAARESTEEHARIVDEASRQRWDAARARFAVEAPMLPDWTMALDQREAALSRKREALERWLVATFEFEAARGGEAEGVR